LKGVFIAYLPIIVIAAIVRLGVKIRNDRRLEIDDGFLVVALCCSLAAWVFVWQIRDLIYLQMEMVLGMKEIELEDLNSMLVYFKWYNASMVLTWMAVYSVKLSFMFFFRKLISRVRPLEIYWWAIMAVLIPSAIFSAFFGFWICTDFSITYLCKFKLPLSTRTQDIANGLCIANCPVSSMMYREEIYLYATAALDIFIDLLIISLPIILLSKINISLKRKLILGMALCLSIFMIVICIIRVTTGKLSNGIIDATWLGLWQCIETNTAIILVSSTTFRSLYRQGASPGYVTPVRITKPSFWPLLRVFKFPSRNRGSEEDEPENYCVLPEKPRRAVLFIKRGATQEEIESQLLPSLDLISDTLVSPLYT
jgi:hypothetical protein